MRVADIMTRDVATLRRNDKLTIADDVMRLGRIRHLPVLSDEGDELVGIVSQRDLFRGALARALGYGQVAQERMLNLLVVKDVMSGHVETASPDTPLTAAAQRMLDSKIGCLPVVENGKLVGILTESDFVALAARGGKAVADRG